MSKLIGRHYDDWSGNKNFVDIIYDGEEVCDFAEYCINEKQKEIIEYLKNTSVFGFLKLRTLARKNKLKFGI